jgi:hypothetical protein
MRQRLGSALRGLWRDGCVVGICVGAALALSAFDVARALGALVTSAIAQPDFDTPDGLVVGRWTLSTGGRTLFLEPLAQSLVALIVVVVVGAIAHRATRRAGGEPESSS